MADLTPANDVSAELGAKSAQSAVKETGVKRRKLRKIILKLSLALTILAPLVFILGALGTKLGLWNWQFGLGVLTMKVGPLLLITGLIMGILALLFAVIVKPRQGVLVGVFGLLVPILAFGKLIHTKSTVEKLPFIHDVSTDTQDPPLFGETILAERAAVKDVNAVDYIGKMAPVTHKDGTKSETLVSALQTKAYPEIRPLVLSGPQEVVFGKALATAKSMGWKIKEEDLATGRIDATHTTFWYGFDDDVTIRLRKSEGGGTIVDVRSLSRIGGSDLGKNAERVSEFLEKLSD